MSISKTILYASLVLTVVLPACKSKKAATPPVATTPKEEKKVEINNTAMLIQAVKMNANNFTYIQADAETDYRDGSNNYSFDMRIVMEKDRYIFVSATALLGIEVARMYITPDQIQIINRLEKKYIVAGYGYLKNFTSAPLEFEQLQNIFAGNSLFGLDENKAKADSADGSYKLVQWVGEVLQSSIHNRTNLKTRESELTDDTRGQKMIVKYAGFVQQGSNFYPNDIAINIVAQKKVECRMKLSNFVFEKKKEVQFSVPQSYKIIRY